MSIPNLDNTIDYGQYGSGSAQRAAEAWQQAHPLKPADSISISLEFLRGAEAAADIAHNDYENTERDEILLSVIAEEVTRLRKEATK